MLILIIGMNGYEPGAKECPDSLTLIQVGGSISSWLKSTYLVVFDAPNRVLPAFVVPLFIDFCKLV